MSIVYVVVIVVDMLVIGVVIVVRALVMLITFIVVGNENRDLAVFFIFKGSYKDLLDDKSRV